MSRQSLPSFGDEARRVDALTKTVNDGNRRDGGFASDYECLADARPVETHV
jgi:hypothetical protein